MPWSDCVAPHLPTKHPLQIIGLVVFECADGYCICGLLCDCSFSSTSGDTPSHAGWAETPRTDRGGGGGIDVSAETPTPHGSKRKSRWDETPASQRMGGTTPMMGTTPSMGTPSIGGATPNFSGATPAGALAMHLQTPSPGQLGSMTPEQMQAWRWERELDERNRPLTDEELDALFPQEGYKVCE